MAFNQLDWDGRLHFIKLPVHLFKIELQKAEGFNQDFANYSKVVLP